MRLKIATICEQFVFLLEAITIINLPYSTTTGSNSKPCLPSQKDNTFILSKIFKVDREILIDRVTKRLGNALETVRISNCSVITMECNNYFNKYTTSMETDKSGREAESTVSLTIKIEDWKDETFIWTVDGTENYKCDLNTSALARINSNKCHQSWTYTNVSETICLNFHLLYKADYAIHGSKLCEDGKTTSGITGVRVPILRRTLKELPQCSTKEIYTYIDIRLKTLGEFSVVEIVSFGADNVQTHGKYLNDSYRSKNFYRIELWFSPQPGESVAFRFNLKSADGSSRMVECSAPRKENCTTTVKSKSSHTEEATSKNGPIIAGVVGGVLAIIVVIIVIIVSYRKLVFNNGIHRDSPNQDDNNDVVFNNEIYGGTKGQGDNNDDGEYSPNQDGDGGDVYATPNKANKVRPQTEGDRKLNRSLAYTTVEIIPGENKKENSGVKEPPVEYASVKLSTTQNQELISEEDQ